MSWCIACGEDFRDDDTGGYNPAARCAEHCRNCCDGRCQDEPIHLDDLCDLCGEPWERCGCDGFSQSVNRTQIGEQGPSPEGE